MLKENLGHDSPVLDIVLQPCFRRENLEDTLQVRAGLVRVLPTLLEQLRNCRLDLELIKSSYTYARIELTVLVLRTCGV
jgi:hypothetical protein